MADSRLEEQLEGFEGVPYAVCRLMNEMRELDSKSSQLQRKLSSAERAVLRTAKARPGRGQEEQLAALESIEKDQRALIGMLAEKRAISVQATVVLTEKLAEMDTELADFESELRSRGEFEIGHGFKIGDEVAARQEENLWILGRIMSFSALTMRYEVADSEDRSKRFTLPSEAIVLIPSEDADEQHHRFQKGESVLAMYPDTTSFYRAVISVAPKRHSSGGPPPVLTVQFADDHDETGVIPHRPVQSRWVLPMPSE